MRDHPTGDELLETARDVLRAKLIPALPASRRHNALMIANAMAIAARQLKAGDTQEREELASLGQILAMPADIPAGELWEALTERNRELCRWIGEGRTQADQLRKTVFQHLLRTARSRREESNPKALGGMSWCPMPRSTGAAST